MSLLNTAPHFGIVGERPRHAYTPGDDFYEMLIEGHRGLSDAQSELMNARLLLLLANHVGDLRVLREAIAAARRGVDPAAAPEGPLKPSSIAAAPAETHP